MIINFKKCLSIFFIFMISTMAFAAVPEWQMIPGESSITFTGTQNGAPATGSFKKFTGEIKLDPNQLNDSKVRMVIDMNSVTTTYSDLTSTLLTPDWFSVKVFPQAVFETTHITKVGDNKYKADGTLTIRDKTVPVTLAFTSEDAGKDKERVKGTTTLKRTAFGIGQGEWADTDTVKDDVTVNFVITAVKK
jgi:polyisoprenoid-binding protein YceI